MTRLQDHDEDEHLDAAYMSATTGPVLAPRIGKGSDLGTCRTCAGIGYIRYDVPVGHPLFGNMVSCPDCGTATEAIRLRAMCRLTGDLEHARLQDWRALPGVESVMPRLVQYLIKRGNGDDRKATGWVTLSGPAGTGKTHLLAALVNHYIEAGVPAIYATMAEILQQLRDTYDADRKASYSALWRDLTDSARVVAIDEVEKFSGTPWAQEQVFAFLNSRWNNMGQALTVLATNIDCRPRPFYVLPQGIWGDGYIESRMRDSRGIIITEFWNAGDARPILSELERARQETLF